METMEPIDIADTCVDAQAMHREYPETFDAPALPEVETARLGWFLKVSRNNERFWTLYVERKGSGWDADITARINNELVKDMNPDLRLHQLVRFKARHIFSVMQPPKDMLDRTKRMARHGAI